MLPEVKEYMAVKEKADKELTDWSAHSRDDQPRNPRSLGWDATRAEHDAYNAAYAVYQEEYRVWNRKYHEEFSRQNAKHEETMRAARAILKETSQDRVIQWLMSDEMERGYWSYIETVLPLLPASREELEELANKHDWCSEFDTFLSQATEAGVIPRSDHANDVQEIIDYIGDEFDVYGRNYRRRIQAMVDKIVDKALAEQSAPLKAAVNGKVKAAV